MPQLAVATTRSVSANRSLLKGRGGGEGGFALFFFSLSFGFGGVLTGGPDSCAFLFFFSFLDERDIGQVSGTEVYGIGKVRAHCWKSYHKIWRLSPDCLQNFSGVCGTTFYLFLLLLLFLHSTYYFRRWVAIPLRILLSSFLQWRSVLPPVLQLQLSEE